MPCAPAGPAAAELAPAELTKDQEDLLEALRDVVDPELGINVVDLGLVYGALGRYAQAEEAYKRALPIKEAKTTIAFYGATPNYAFQFDDLGHTGLRDKLAACLKAGDSAGSEALITDGILDQFAIVARWDDVAQRMIERYKGIASRLVIYLASHWREVDPKVLERWGEIARAVRKAR